MSVFNPHLGEVARASLARVTELCGATFWRKSQFYRTFKNIQSIAMINGEQLTCNARSSRAEGRALYLSVDPRMPPGPAQFLASFGRHLSNQVLPESGLPRAGVQANR